MLYDVKLRIAYSYETPSDHSRLVLRLLPNDIPATQKVLARLLTLDPMPAERRERAVREVAPEETSPSTRPEQDTSGPVLACYEQARDEDAMLCKSRKRWKACVIRDRRKGFSGFISAFSVVSLHPFRTISALAG